jgi:hypothetical protein
MAEQKPVETHSAPLHDAWLTRAADARGNLVRILCIAGFYGVHLLHYWLPGMEAWLASELPSVGIKPVSANMHLAVSLVVLGWLLQAFGLHLASVTNLVSRRIALLAALGDAFWLTVALCCTRGAASPMVAGYFLVIALAGLRLDFWLVRWATVFSVAGYLLVLGITRWPQGLLLPVDLPAVPRYHQLMVVLALVFEGLIVGQLVRLAWGVVARRARPAGGEHE